MYTIGNLNVRLGADTAGLQKAVNDLTRLGRQIDTLSRSSNKGDQSRARSLANQEHAMRELLQRTMDLNRALRQLESPERANLIANNTRSYQQLSRWLANGQRDAIAFSRAMDLANSRLGQSRRAMQNLRAEEQAGKLNKFANVFRDLESASVLAVGPLSGIGARIRAIGSIANRSALGIAAFFGGITAGLVAFAGIVKGSISARKEIDQINSALMATTGSAAVAAEEFQFLADTSQKFGVDLGSSAKEYAKLQAAIQGTNISMVDARKLYEGVSAAAATFKLDQQSVEGVFRSLTQMISKGNVQAEELRGQFGERIPGGFQLAAAAIGATTSELGDLLKSGSVLADDLIPKLADAMLNRFGRSGMDAAKTLGAELNRLNTRWLLLRDTVDSTYGITNKYKAGIVNLSDALDSLRGNLHKVEQVAAAVGTALLFAFAPSVMSGILAISGAVWTLTKGILALNTAVLANPIGALASVLIRVSAAVAGATIGWLLMRDASAELGVSTSNLTKDIQHFIDTAEKAGAASSSMADAFLNAAKSRRGAVIEEIKTLETLLKSDNTLKAPSGLNQMLSKLGLAGAAFDIQKFFGVGQESDAAINTLQKLREELKLLDEQSSTLSSMVGSGKSGIGELGTDAQNALDDIRELGREYKNLQDTMRALQGSGDAGHLELGESIFKASEALRGLSTSELTVLREELDKLGYTTPDLAAAFAQLMLAVDDAKTSAEEYAQKLEKTPEIMAATTEQISRMRQEIEALNKGSDAVDKLNAQFSRADAVKKFREELEKTTLTQEEINQRTGEFIFLWESRVDAERRLERINSVGEKVAKGFERGFDRIGEAITDAFIKGEEASIKFGNIANAVMSEILQTLLEIAIFDPLKSAGKSILGSVFEGIAGSLFTGGGASASAASMSRASSAGAFTTYRPTGGAYGFAHGGRPSVGMPSIVGEKGRELFVPDTSGTIITNDNLRRAAQGGGSNVNVVINNYTDGNASVERSSNGNQENIIVTIERNLAGRMKSGQGSLGPAIHQITGTGRQTKKR